MNSNNNNLCNKQKNSIGKIYIVPNLRKNKKKKKNKNMALPTIPPSHFKSFSSYNRRNRRGTVRCGIIVFNQAMDSIVIILNKYSLKKGGTGKWGLPKGHRNPDETYPNCASREGWEETGLYTIIDSKSQKVLINNTYYFPIISKKEAQLKPHDPIEIADAQWIKIEKIKKMTINRELQLTLDILDRIKHIANRTNASIYEPHKTKHTDVYIPPRT